MAPIPIRRKSVDLPHSVHAFSQSPHNAHIVYGSVGRSAFADSFLGSPGQRASEHNPLLDSVLQEEDENEESQTSNNYNHNNNNYNNYGDEEGYGHLTSDSRFVVTPEQARKLAQEEQEILNLLNRQGGPSYGAINASTDSPNNRLLPNEVEPEISGVEDVAAINKAWDDAVDQGIVETTFRHELKYLTSSSIPLIITFLLQYSLTIASIFSVGHLGKSELAAVSLGSMTANITGFALIQGLATCLDTLCAQAYGAGKYFLVGEYFQKCTLMIIACFIPIGVCWIYSEPALALFVGKEDPALVSLAASYLRIVLIGSPAYIAFECGKRFVQAQGIFHASTYVLIICAPINAVLNYLLVWSPLIGIGFKGAPTAVVISQWLMAFLLFFYVLFIDGRKCWGGISKKVFANWAVMFRLAIPGVIMIEAEFFAFEILTLAAAQLGTTALAAQSVVATISSMSYQIPFALSIASSTRIANYIGASLAKPAIVAKDTSLFMGSIVGIFNGIMLYTFRYSIGSVFSNDEDVVALVAETISVLVFAVIVDAPGAVLGGILRGMGRQSVGGYFNLIAYYVLATPLGIVLTFKANMHLAGLWTGIALALTSLDIAQYWYIQNCDWDLILGEARNRQQFEVIVE